MSSFRQIEANRRNSLKSTGPTTSAGKDRSRRNAVRHGLTAETVVTAVEDAADYQAFESSVISDYEAETAVKRELVLRLASLLWRLRRATSIETGLLQASAEFAMSIADRSQLSFTDQNAAPPESQDLITQCFLLHTRAQSDAFERVRRYETALWRQLRQTLSMMKVLSWQPGKISASPAKPRRWNAIDPCQE